MKKKIFTLLLCMAMALPAFIAGAETLTVNGQTRTFYPYVPNNLGDKRPMMISMHGMNQDAGYQRGMLQIEDVADTAKFVVVFPEGIDRGWDIGGTRDINFVLAIIDYMAEKYNIDTNRVYLSGFSMGGMFTYHAMNHIADRIAAFAPISGYPMGGQEHTSARPVPIIHTHGTSDDVVSFSGVQNALDGWIERNGCTGQPIVTEGYRYNGCTRYQWGPGEEGAEVVLIKRYDKGHWIANDVFKTGEEIWNFCKRYSLENKYPKVSVKSPKADSSVQVVGGKMGKDILLEASASSAYGNITSVKFYVDDEYVGEAGEKPYAVNWENAKSGTHYIKATATDDDGNSATRGITVKVSVGRSSLNLGNAFKEDCSMPAGWVGYDGMKLTVGPASNVTSGAHVKLFTSEAVDFTAAMYMTNKYGRKSKGYATYGDSRGNTLFQIGSGTFSLKFSACCFDMAECGTVRYEIKNATTSDVVLTGGVIPALSLGGSQTNPFTGATEVEEEFEVLEQGPFILTFYADDTTGADALVANVSIKKLSSTGIEDIDGAAEAVATECYDVNGRQVPPGHKGLVLKRTVYSDGRVSTSKVINR